MTVIAVRCKDLKWKSLSDEKHEKQSCMKEKNYDVRDTSMFTPIARNGGQGCMIQDMQKR
jgi:hypothetical protein